MLGWAGLGWAGLGWAGLAGLGWRPSDDINSELIVRGSLDNERG